MVKNRIITEGWTFPWVATAAVVAGDIISTADRIGRVANDAAIGEKVSVQIRGVLELPKDGSAYPALTAVNWDGSQITSLAGTPAGFVTEDAAAGDAFVRVSINS